MTISREAYDRKPLLIRQGALQIWGVPLAKRVDMCRIRELYSFSDFFAEICSDKSTGKVTCICSFANSQRLTPYLDQLDLQELIQEDQL